MDGQPGNFLGGHGAGGGGNAVHLGRVPDEGACVELGIAYALGKKCIGYKTDDRNLDFTGDDNLFIEGCMDFKVIHNKEELKKALMEN